MSARKWIARRSAAWSSSRVSRAAHLAGKFGTLSLRLCGDRLRFARGLGPALVDRQRRGAPHGLLPGAAGGDFLLRRPAGGGRLVVCNLRGGLRLERLAATTNIERAGPL